MLRGSNTTISIAHRLSTIQRSDIIIVIGSDGRIAQTGPYSELSRDKEGAFAKLMEWQMSGATPMTRPENTMDVDPELTEEERRKMRLEEHDRKQERQQEDEGEEAAPEEEKEAQTVKASGKE